MRRKFAAALLFFAAALALTGCGGGGGKAKTYADGTYEGTSDVYINEDEDSEDGNGYGVVTITIENNVITACTYQTYEVDGTLKDEDYGKEGGQIANKDYYRKAQKAVAACEKYAQSLVESGSLDEVDAISGATVNYDEFRQAVKAALAEAEVKE